MFSINPQHTDVLKQIMRTASGKGSVAAYANAFITVKSSGVNIICGDGAIELSTTLQDCDQQQDGALCVDAQKLLQAITACKFDCTVFIKDGFAEVKNAKSKFKLQSINPDAYPSYPDTGDLKPVDCDAATLVQQIKSAAFIAPEQDVRHFLNGVRIGDFVAATDGFRMVKIDCAQTPEVIIPIKSAKLLPDDAAQVYVSSNFMSVVTDSITFKTKLIDGRFPDVARAIGKPDKKASINVASFVDALRASQVTANKTTNGVLVQIDGNKGTVTANSGGNELSVIEFEASAESKIDMGFNCKYLLDAMNYHNGDLEVGFSDRQMIIEQTGFVNVVMMLRV